MSLSRRDLLRNLSVIGAVAATPLTIGCSSADDESEPETQFKHGVASGDPLPDAIILWTRVTPKGSETSIDVKWELSASRDFTTIDKSGNVTTNADRDFTVKVDVTGLSPGTTYYYRFTALGGTSPRGRTRTAPTGSLARLRFGVVSCSSLAHGYFHAYRHLASRLDLDAIVHLGDYIYEYGNREYGEVREYEPPHEITTLADYRMRYSQYRRDPDLQAIHRQFPFITVWDDHESADNSWKDGANNHQAGEGDWKARLAAAAKVYSEWMPIRDQDGGKIYRAFTFGDLVDLIMLDTRIIGREEEAEKKSDPVIQDPARQLLGAEQEAFLGEKLKSSKTTWQLLGQQVVMAPFLTFFNTDAWDGYPAARERVYKMIEENAARNVVVLTGDVHMSFGFELVRDPKSPDYDPMTGKGSIGAEFVVPGVTSPGFPEQLANAAKGMVVDNPHCKFANVHSKGYLVLDITKERVQGAWYHYTEVDLKEATPQFSAAYSIAAGQKRLVADASEAAAPANAPAAG